MRACEDANDLSVAVACAYLCTTVSLHVVKKPGWHDGRNRVMPRRIGAEVFCTATRQARSGFNIRCALVTPCRSMASRPTVPLLCRAPRRRHGWRASAAVRSREGRSCGCSPGRGPEGRSRQSAIFRLAPPFSNRPGGYVMGPGRSSPAAARATSGLLALPERPSSTRLGQASSTC